MRIGIITQSYYPVRGGVAEHVWHLARELERRGHAVTIVTGGSRHPDDRGRRVIRIGSQIPFMANGAHVSVTWGWKLGRRLQRIEARERFDLVHIQCPFEPGLPMIAAKAMRTPKVATHHMFRKRNLFIEWFPGVYRDVLKKIQSHIAVSPSAAELVKKYFPDTPLHIIPNGVDTDRFRPDVEPWPEYRDGVFTVLFVGRMDPRKGAKFLLLAMPYLEKALPDYRLLIVGDGWMRRYYDKYVPLRLQHRVRFAGYATPEDLPRYYRSADVFCSPALGGESFGIVLAEAMACGTPVVASDIEGYRWVVEPGREGLLVPPRSPRLLAESLIVLAQDPAKRKTMGAAGRQKALTYAWPKVTDRIEHVYASLLGHRLTSDRNSG